MEKLRFWDILEKSWRSVLNEYINHSQVDGLKRDLPYWHCERANTSFLAAAAWKMGAIAIEEYYTERGSENSKDDSKGHCDLWVKLKNFSFSAEAKQLFPKVYKKESIQTKTREAEKQLGSLAKDDKGASNCLYSICFVSPILNDKTGFSDFYKRVKDDFENQDCRVFCFDKSKLEDEIITWQKKEEKFPGVIMLVKEFKQK